MLPAGTDVGPVTIDCKWSNQQPSKFDKDSHWVVMACEIARQGNLRRFISPLDRQGKTLLTQIEGEQRPVDHNHRRLCPCAVVQGFLGRDVGLGSSGGGKGIRKGVWEGCHTRVPPPKRKIWFRTQFATLHISHLKNWTFWELFESFEWGQQGG